MAKVGIQGIKGSYSEQAATLIFGEQAVIAECENFEDTFASLDNGIVEFLVVPVHNKIVGDIEIATSLINKGDYKLIDSITIEINHVLAGVKGAEIDKLTSIYSHVEALKQCRKFLKNYPNLKPYAAADTALSICNVVKNGTDDEAAIGSKRAAELYNAEILLENIADDRENWTTFNLLTK